MESMATQRGLIYSATLTGTTATWTLPVNTPLNLSIVLTSADSTRAIAISFDGTIWHTVSTLDFTATGQIVFGTSLPIVAIKVTGIAGDVLNVLG